MKPLPVVTDADVHLSALLGRGRHGSVFVAHLGGGGDGSTVAIKIPRCTDRSFEEFEVLTRFDHPHIVNVVAEPLSNGSLLLEYCSGGTLADRLDERHLTATEARQLMARLADALAELHNAGWIHGDVSPRNIAFREDNTPVLIDFTTARPSDGSPIEEGTDQFTGPIREATPALDTRALAATVLLALGEDRSWNRAERRLRTQLDAAIERADAGYPVVVEELLSTGPVGESEGVAESAAELRTGVTRSFGPQPPRAEIGGSNTGAGVSRSAWLLVAVAIVAVLGFGSEWLLANRTTAQASRVENTEPAGQLVRAATTIARSEAAWDSTTGTLQLNSLGGATAWQVGRAGDLAAVGDWNCDGMATLGVYRPSTGSWFAFDSWDEQSTSATPETLDVDAAAFSVAIDSDGCAKPQVRG